VSSLEQKLRQPLAFFLARSKNPSAAPLGSGNVNDTWLIGCETGEQYVLQRLNAEVFPDPALIQNNLDLVTRHLRDRLQPSDHPFTVFRPIAGRDGLSYLDERGDCWRLLTYIRKSRAVNTISGPAQAAAVGRGLGLFHSLLADLPTDTLADPLPGFHVTPKYLEQFDAIQPVTNRAGDCEKAVAERRQDVFLLEEERAAGRMSIQVIHGDPKAANFLFSRDGTEIISLIDLDTVKPGLLLHDIGDCLRSCCNPRGEECEPENVVFDPLLFASLLQGYRERAVHLLTDSDKSLIVDSVRLISFELGLRFYTDFLQGDRYFKTSRAGQNLFRARVQFALVRSIEEQYTALEKTCARIMESGRV
jgi:Ser/Thr protein kinase RdoA (MazF antagonist)